MHFSADNIGVIDGLNYQYQKTSMVVAIDSFTDLLINLYYIIICPI